MSIYLGTVKMSGSAGIAGGDASVIASNITLSTTAQPYITINNSSKTIALPATDPYNTARTPTSHTHGQLTNDGKITSTSVSLDSGDNLVFVDSSDSSKIKKSSITFDGSTTTKYLSQAGTWVSVPTGGGTLVVPFTVNLGSSPMTVSTTTSIDTIINAINDGKYVVGEAILYGLMRFQLEMWWEDDGNDAGNYRTVIFSLQVNLNAYVITGESNYSGSTWIDEWTIEEQSASLNSLSDVHAESPTDGQILAYSANYHAWMPTSSAGGGGGSTVTLPSGYSASTGITLNSSSLTTIATIDGTELKLKAPAGGGGGGGSSTLSGLNDVSISSALSGQSLVFNGTNWVNSFNSAGFNQVTAVYDANASLQGCSLFRANCAGNKRNFIIVSLLSSHFPQGEELVVYLDNAVPYTDNYIFIDNGTGSAQSWCPDALAIFDSSTNNLNDFILLPADSNGNNVIDIPNGYSLWGAVNVGFGGSGAAAMLTFGGRFNEV